MGVRIFCVGLILVLCLMYAFSKPQESVVEKSGLTSEQKRQIRDRLIKFVEIEDIDDNDVRRFALDENNFHRIKRQSNKEDTFEEQEKPGFFDRAAKFLTQLLQRFLKWINSSDDKRK
ncbi:hypothetical protein RN001_014822 [Aquatica leii]|uniref:Uncharacterized protein n=1 Tax=Aquatica leii TaxID=1421715 RepID=A0AAN7QC35_9COLE|nr:hypothetical protein RN001_014822 [Aquatica leii]